MINKLQSYQISINKVQMIKILKFLEIQNPNAFNINDLITKLSKYTEQRLPNNNQYNNAYRPKSTLIRIKGIKQT